MQIVSDIFERAVKGRTRTIETKIVIAGTEVSPAHVVDFKIEDIIGNGDDISIGEFSSSFLQIKFNNIFSVMELNIGASVKPYIRFKNLEPLVGEDDWSEYLPLGEYFIDSLPKIEGDSVSVTAYDKAIYGDVEFTSTAFFPMSMQTIFNQVTTLAGFTVGASVSINPDYVIQYYNNTEPMTIRGIIGRIAGCHGANAVISKLGVLEFVYVDSSDVNVENITLGTTLNYEKKNPLRKVTNVIVVGETESFQSGSTIKGETLYTNNPFATQVIADNIFNLVNGFTYQPVKIKYIGFPHLSIGDRIGTETLVGSTWVNTLETWESIEETWEGIVTSDTILLKTTLSFTGGLSSTIESKGMSTQQREYILEGSLTRKLSNLSSTALRDSITYYGVRMTQEEGITVRRVDQFAKVILNADTFTMQTGDGAGNYTDALKFNTITKKYEFTGDIVMNGGSISWNNVTPPTASQVGALPNGTFIPTLPSYIGSTKITNTDIETCTITANTITGNTITGNTITGGTITGTVITSNSVINVTTNVNIGGKLLINKANGGSGIRWSTLGTTGSSYDAGIYTDPAGALLINSAYGGSVWINGSVALVRSSISTGLLSGGTNSSPTISINKTAVINSGGGQEIYMQYFSDHVEVKLGTSGTWKVLAFI